MSPAVAHPKPAVIPHVRRQRKALLAQFYTVADVCALMTLRPEDPPLCEKTFIRMCKRGEFPIPKVVLPGRLVVYRRDLVDEWLKTDFVESRTSRPIRRRGGAR